MKIEENIKRLAQKANTSTETYKILENYIKKEILNGTKIHLLKTMLEEELKKELSFDSLKKFVANKKEEWEKENNPAVIAIVNFKGGVGKSTIANLLDLPEKIIVNLDVAQDAKKINSAETYNFHQLKEEYGIETIQEAIQGAIEGGKKNIILDTPGEIDSFIEALAEVDYFIVPFTPGDRSIEATLTTITTINMLLEEMSERRKDKWCIVMNRFLNDKDLEELENVYLQAEELLGDKLVCKTYLKNSQVIPSMERKKMSIQELIKENPIAYGIFKKRVSHFNEEVKNFLKG